MLFSSSSSNSLTHLCSQLYPNLVFFSILYSFCCLFAGIWGKPMPKIRITCNDPCATDSSSDDDESIEEEKPQTRGVFVEEISVSAPLVIPTTISTVHIDSLAKFKSGIPLFLFLSCCLLYEFDFKEVWRSQLGFRFNLEFCSSQILVHERCKEEGNIPMRGWCRKITCKLYLYKFRKIEFFFFFCLAIWKIEGRDFQRKKKLKYGDYRE